MSVDGSIYRVTQTLLASERSILYRGVRRSDDARVLLKVLGPRHALPPDVRRLEHERRVALELEGAGALRPLALDHFQGLPALVLEDPGGQPLSTLLEGPLEVGRFLRLAIAIAGALSRVHRRGIIHKDLQPASILVDEASGAVWLIELGIASVLPREQPAAGNPIRIEGTLAYMSPEQTGRMNRALDHRTDLYSLGVTFYEALPGRLPFTASDPLEWVHCHVARQPRPPDRDLPGPLTQILMKLLAKAAEHRYQSAAGLARDLERCRGQWEASGRIDTFPLGQGDAPDRLAAPAAPVRSRAGERGPARGVPPRGGHRARPSWSWSRARPAWARPSWCRSCSGPSSRPAACSWPASSISTSATSPTPPWCTPSSELHLRSAHRERRAHRGSGGSACWPRWAATGG